MSELFGEPIFSYTRADAIEDGVLLDITPTAKEAGFKYPVAMTSAAYGRYVEVPPELEGEQDVAGRLWDVCWMLLVAVKGGMDPVNPTFEFICRIPDKGNWQKNEKLVRELGREHRKVTLRALCHGGDEGEPVITIMMPWED